MIENGMKLETMNLKKAGVWPYILKSRWFSLIQKTTI